MIKAIIDAIKRVCAPAVRPEGCICKTYTRNSVGPVNGCPVHAHFEKPLYPIKEIKAAGDSEREKACHSAGLFLNKCLRDKWDRE